MNDFLEIQPVRFVNLLFVQSVFPRQFLEGMDLLFRKSSIFQCQVE